MTAAVSQLLRAAERGRLKAKRLVERGEDLTFILAERCLAGGKAPRCREQKDGRQAEALARATRELTSSTCRSLRRIAWQRQLRRRKETTRRPLS